MILSKWGQQNNKEQNIVIRLRGRKIKGPLSKSSS